MTTVQTSPGPTGSSAPDPNPRPSSFRAQVVGPLSTVGDIVQFSGKIIRELPEVRKYSAEVLRQASVLVLSSGLIIWIMQGVIGTMCATEASYTLKQVGAPLYSGVFTAFCGLRELSPFMWGYIFAAKVGCGMVAELGSMRIADEVDAMEVMGIKSRVYLVGTRVLATWLAIPFLYLIGLGVTYYAMYAVVVLELKGVSSGGYNYIFWLYQNPMDLLYSTLKTMSYGTVVVLVSCYYGFTASGGPVGVGKATARSMMLNLVLIHILGVLGTQLFWGMTPNAPIAN